jgi:hypothetical protein
VVSLGSGGQYSVRFAARLYIGIVARLWIVLKAGKRQGMKPIDQAKQGLKGMGKSRKEINDLVAASQVDPAYLDERTNQAKNVYPSMEPLDWVLDTDRQTGDQRLIVRKK